jgi:hypothetical protein
MLLTNNNQNVHKSNSQKHRKKSYQQVFQLNNKKKGELFLKLLKKLKIT